MSTAPTNSFDTPNQVQEVGAVPRTKQEMAKILKEYKAQGLSPQRSSFWNSSAGTGLKVTLVATLIIALLVGAGLLAYYCPGGANHWCHVTLPTYQMALIMGSAAITLIVGAILFCKFAVPAIVGDRKGRIEIKDQTSDAEKAASGKTKKQQQPSTQEEGSLQKKGYGDPDVDDFDDNTEIERDDDGLYIDD